MADVSTVDSPSGTATARPSLRDAVTSAVRATLKTTNSGSEEPTPASESAAPAEISTDVPDEEQGATPSTDGKKDVPAHKADERTPSPDGQKTEVPAVEDNSTTLDAPKVWPAGERESFAKLPDDAKKLILAREKAHNSRFTKNTQDNAAHRRFADEVRGLFTPRDREFMKANGVDEVVLLKRMADFNIRLSQDPVKEVKALMGRLGITPEKLGLQGGGTEAQPNPSSAKPEGQAAPSPVDPVVLNRVSNIENLLQQAYQETQQHALGRFEQEVTTFEREQDEAGNLRYPHFEALFDPMMHFIQTDPEIAAVKLTQPRKAIEMAYEKACWLNPDIRSEMVAGERSRAAQTQQQREIAQKAKAAASPKTSAGAGGAGVASAKPKSLREAVTAAVRSTNRN